MKYIAIVLLLFVWACSGEKEQPLPSEPGEITVIHGETPQDNTSPLLSYNMRGESRVDFVPGGQEEDETTKAVGAAAVSRSAPYSSYAKRLAEKSLGKDYVIKCAPCHDDYANGVIGPSLLDKSADDVYNMLVKYRDKAEPNPLMQAFVDKMTEEELRDMSARIADFNETMGKKNE